MIKKINIKKFNCQDFIDSAINSYEKLTEEQKKKLKMSKEDYIDTKFFEEIFKRDRIIIEKTIIALKKTINKEKAK